MSDTNEGGTARSVRVARIGDVIRLSETLAGKASFAAGQEATIESTFEMGGITTYRCRIADGRTVLVRRYHLNRIEDRPALAPGVTVASPDDAPRMYGDGGDDLSFAVQLDDMLRPDGGVLDLEAARAERYQHAVEVTIRHTDGTPPTVLQTMDPEAILAFEEMAFTDDNVSVVEVRPAASADVEGERA